MAARKFFSTSLVSTCIESNSRFFQSFRPRKSLFLPFSKEKHVLQAACFVPSKVFYVHSAIDHPDPGVDYELTRNKPCTPGLLRYLCLAGFLCGYSLHHCDNGLCQRKRRGKRKLCPCELWSPQRSFSLQKALERDEKSRRQAKVP